jgi:hypothetical protein
MSEDIKRYYGVYRGTVYSNKDPLKQRRLRLVIPALLGNEPTNWAWPVDPSGVTLQPPATNQGVWVTFENGDPSFPIWLGVFGKMSANQVDILALSNKVTELNQRVTTLEGKVATLETIISGVFAV